MTDSVAPPRQILPLIGIVGGGQLAQMMIHAQDEAGVQVKLLASPSDESAPATGANTVRCERFDGTDLIGFGQGSVALTFDHELVDPLALREAEQAGLTLRPSSGALGFSDKAYQRLEFKERGLPVPKFATIDQTADIDSVVKSLSYPAVFKSARGGYDGRGVIIVSSPDEARTLLQGAFAANPAMRFVVEPMLNIASEAAVLVVRDRGGRHAAYPVFDTLQEAGMCREVSYPSALPADIQQKMADLAIRVAETVQAVGVLATEFFIVDGEVLINEVAPRPHNSGHLTIEAFDHSQFALHLGSAAGQEVPHLHAATPAAAMVNLVGTENTTAIALLTHELSNHEPFEQGYEATIHDYNKTPRAGRKLGHVTVVGPNVDRARQIANTIAHRYASL